MSISRITDNIYALRFLRLLTMNARDTQAFKLGLIDEKANRTEKEIETAREKAAYTYFHRLVFNIRRMLERISFGRQRIASYVTALALIREETMLTTEDLSVISEDLGLNDIMLEDKAELELNMKVKASSEFIINEDFETDKVKIGDIIIVEDKIDDFEKEEIFRGFHIKSKKKVYLTARDVTPVDL